MRMTGFAIVSAALSMLSWQSAGAQEMTFFITSEGPGDGANLGGIAGADQHCQQLAGQAGAGDGTWHAYLSQSSPAAPIDARDRIGEGPWYNADGVMVARNVDDLHSESNNMTKETILDENGNIVSGSGDETNRHDILTGSRRNGTAWPWGLIDVLNMDGDNHQLTCGNWTSNDENGSVMLGHHDRRGFTGYSSWNAAHPSVGCSQEDLRATGGDGLFYCFAVNTTP